MTDAIYVDQRTFDPGQQVKTPLFLVEYNHLDEVLDRNTTPLAIDYDKVVNFGEDGDGEDWLVFSAVGILQIAKALDLVVEQRFGTHITNVEEVTFARCRHLHKSVRNATPAFKRWLPMQFETNLDGDAECYVTATYIAGHMFAPALGRKVTLHPADVYGSLIEPSPRGAFQIYLGARATEECTLREITGIFGHTFTCGDNRVFRQPTAPFIDEDALGVFIMDGEVAVAELLPNALYIHHSLFCCNTAEALAAFQAILDRALVMHALDDKERAKLHRKALRQLRQRQDKLLAEVVERSIPKRLKRDAGKIEQAEARSAQLLKEYFDAEREAFVLRSTLHSRSRAAEQFVSEIKKLQSGLVYKVERVAIGPQDRARHIDVFTDVIYARDQRSSKLHRIGKFQIRFMLEQPPDDHWARFTNLDGQPAGRNQHAPHVDGNGRPCLGTIKRELPGYIANYEIEAATTLAIAFLESVDVTDAWGQNIIYFPIVEEQAVAA